MPLLTRNMMKLYQNDIEFGWVFGVFADDFEKGRISQIGQLVSVSEAKRLKFSFWCENGPPKGLYSYTLREQDMAIAVEILTSMRVTIRDDEGRELPCYRVEVLGPPIQSKR